MANLRALLLSPAAAVAAPENNVAIKDTDIDEALCLPRRTKRQCRVLSSPLENSLVTWKEKVLCCEAFQAPSSSSLQGAVFHGHLDAVRLFMEDPFVLRHKQRGDESFSFAAWS